MRRLAVRYGRHHSQIGELWHPGTGGDAHPLVVVIHGGFWKGVYTKWIMHRLCGAIADAGFAAWNIEYRRVGRLGFGGGWPHTFEDVASAVDHLARLPGIDLDRVVTCGHSAGGHLALWAAARSRLPPGAPGGGPVVRPRGALSLAGVPDLVRAAGPAGDHDAVRALLGGGPDDHPDRYALASPAALLPIGVTQSLVHGQLDRTVDPSYSREYAAAATAAGDDARYLPVDGVDHMAMIRPRSPAWPTIAAELDRLLG